MKILFVTWELDPLIKLGGLGDVARTLPASVLDLGHDIRTILPFYKAIRFGKTKKKNISIFEMDFVGKKEKVEIFQVLHPYNHVPVYLVRNKNYLDVAKNTDTFAFFCKAVVEAIMKEKLSFTPEIIHCNDYHTGLIPLLLKLNNLSTKTLLTIHNLAYQGRSGLDILEKLGVEKSNARLFKWEIKSKQVNFLVEGIIHADIINTVSPSYAKEILTEEYGAGVDDILRGKEGRLFGILNGIEVGLRSRHSNSFIAYPYLNNDIAGTTSKHKKIFSWQEGKKLNKILLQKRLKLTVNPNIPLSAFIGRFASSQKGLDILHRMLRRVNLNKMQFVILGTGDKDWEERFQWLSSFYPKSISTNFVFDEKLARLIYAGADFMLIPSKFEPCGLIQMVAMRYGTLPIAHKTGGLKDSIKDNVNGFLFDKYSSYSLEHTLNKAIGIKTGDKERFDKMMREAMSTDFSWIRSAREYVELYQKLLSGQY